jgi:hypothetical protein
MKTTITGLALLALLLVGGAVAQAPSPNMYWVAPDGGSIQVSAYQGVLWVSMQQGGRSAQMAITAAGVFPGTATVTVNEGLAVSRLTVSQGIGTLEVSNSQGKFSTLSPDGLWIGGARKF